MLRKLRQAMGHRDTLYRLTEIVELDDALIGGKRPGKRGRGAEGKTPVLIACETRGGKPGFVAMEQVASVNLETVDDFAKRRIRPGEEIHTDALAALGSLSEHHHHIARITPPEPAQQWLPWCTASSATSSAFCWGLITASVAGVSRSISMNSPIGSIAVSGNPKSPTAC